MKSNLLIISFVCVVLIHFSLLKISCSPRDIQVQHVGRIKRKVLFLPKAQWFVRFNNRFTIFNYSTIFVHGWGFKIAYELPTTLSDKGFLFKRDVDFDIEDYIPWIDKQQFYYIMNQVCKNFLRKNVNRCGISCKIQEIINRSNGSDSSLFRSMLKKCDRYSQNLQTFINDASNS